MLEPIYTVHNCSFSAPLQWSLTIFWKDEENVDEWFADLKACLDADGIRLLNHCFVDKQTSQFAISTQPDVSPKLIVQRVKGRLGYEIRQRKPKPFKRNFSIRSLGSVTREATEAYVQKQLGHHRMADDRVQDSLAQFQFVDEGLDLSAMQYTSHGTYWYNLHLVLVMADRWCEVRPEFLQSLYSMTLRTGKKWACRISRFGLLPDHIHMVMGVPFDASPSEISLSFLNNFSFVYDMKAMYQYGAYVGTVGEYTNKAF